jgi:DNA-binding NtrC family response regulator
VSSSTIDLGGASDDPRGLYLLVMSATVYATHRLPDSGILTIGREATDIVLTDPLASRQHARLVIAPSEILLEDLGSANGTRVGNDRIRGQQVPVGAGVGIIIGATTLLLCTNEPLATPFQVLEHEEFEERLRQECVRSSGIGAFLAVARLRLAQKPTGREVLRAASDAALRRSDSVACYSDRDYELLLVGAPPEEAQRLVSDFVRALEERGLQARSEIAYFPYDGRAADALISRAGALLDDADSEDPNGLLVAEDESMRRAQSLADKAALTTMTVLILGETGVGKSALARRIHERSPRSSGPLIAMNCASVPEHLVESELFGHERGAFTGAFNARPGLLESAHGGTFFLDEVGDLPIAVQAKLLLALQDGVITRVGGRKPIPLDVRFIAATHRDLDADVRERRFRADLYYRINVVVVRVPPLRERRTDIPALARRFVNEASARHGLRSEPRLTPEALAVLQRFSWPGNIRQLQNVIQRALIDCNGSEITVDDLPENVTHEPTHPPPTALPGQPVDELHAWILTALGQTHGNQTKAAEIVGVTRVKLNRLMKKYGIPRLQDP